MQNLRTKRAETKELKELFRDIKGLVGIFRDI